MSVARALLGVASVLLANPTAYAQSVLDRTDPTQEDEVERGEVPERADDVPVTPEDQATQPITGEAFDVGAIVIAGGGVLDTADFLDIIERFGARSLTPGELGELSDAIANRARERGFIFANAWIEPQSLSSGVLRVRLDEGTIDEIRIVGDDDPAIRAQLEPLRSGMPVTLSALQRHVLIAGDIPGVYIRRTRFEREGQRGILVVEAIRSRFLGRLMLENDGSQPIGPERARIDFTANGLVSSFDRLDLTASTTPFAPSELQYGRARYAMVVGRGGTELAATGSYSATEPGAYLADRHIVGKSWRLGAEIRHPLRRSQDLSVWLEGEVEFRDLRQEREKVLARHDRIPVIRASLYSLAALADGQMRGRLTLSRGLDILDATERGDPLASRADASAVFTSLSGWIEWERDVAKGFSLAVAGRGQISTDPLLATEDVGLGGTRFLRGYNFSERAGDEGIMGYGEVRYDWARPLGLTRKLQLYGYVDGGVVGNLGSGRGGGSLASAGGGMRADLARNLDLGAELAFPLTGPRYDTGDLSPRLNLRLSYRL